jgi:hypothetical protein
MMTKLFVTVLISTSLAKFLRKVMTHVYTNWSQFCNTSTTLQHAKGTVLRFNYPILPSKKTLLAKKKTGHTKSPANENDSI